MRRKGSKKDAKANVWIWVTIKVYLEGKVRPEKIEYKHKAGAGGDYWSTFQATPTRSMMKIEGYKQTLLYNLDRIEKVSLELVRSDGKEEPPNHEESKSG